jgi:hypothetical protein
MKIDVHKTALNCNTLITSLNNVHLGYERALITLNPYETQQLIEALQKTQEMSEDEVLNTIAGKGMAVGGVAAEVAQVEIDTEMVT